MPSEDQRLFGPKPYITDIHASLHTTAVIIDNFAMDVLLPTFWAVGWIGDSLELDSNEIDSEDGFDDSGDTGDDGKEMRNRNGNGRREAKKEKMRKNIIDATLQRVFVATLQLAGGYDS